MQASIGGPSDGYFPKDEFIYLVAHKAIVLGDVAALDQTTVANFDALTGAPFKTKDPTSLTEDMFVVAMEDVAISARGRFLIRGVTTCKSLVAQTTGDALQGFVGTTLHLVDAATVGAKIIATAWEDLAAAGVVKCDFNGKGGLGHVPG